MPPVSSRTRTTMRRMVSMVRLFPKRPRRNRAEASRRLVITSVMRATRGLDFDTYKRKRLNRLTLVGADSRETSTCGVSWSDDDGQTWSTARNVDLNDARPTLTRLGTFRKRQFRITNSSDAPMELEAMELDVEELAA